MQLKGFFTRVLGVVVAVVVVLELFAFSTAVCCVLHFEASRECFVGQGASSRARRRKEGIRVQMEPVGRCACM